MYNSAQCDAFRVELFVSYKA